MPRSESVGTHVVALGGVVVDDVEDHLDVGVVQGLHHRLELLHVVGRTGGVAVVRGEEGDRVVAPVVAQAALDEVVVVEEVVHRHQLDGGDAEAGEMVDDRRVGDAGVGAAQFRRHVRVAHGESAHVGLVDDRLVHRVLRSAVVAPVEERIADHAGRHVRRAVGGVRSERVGEVVGEAGRVPVDLAVDGLGVGVEEQLGRVAPEPVGRVPRAVHAVAVVLAGAHVGEVGVPAVAVDLLQGDALLAPRGGGAAGRRALGRLQQAQLDGLGHAREQGEVGARSVVGGAERIRPADPDAPRGVRDGFDRRRRLGAGGRPTLGSWHRGILPNSRFPQAKSCVDARFRAPESRRPGRLECRRWSG